MNNKYVICTTCTIRLVDIAYSRSWWFKLIREPLRLGMILLAKMHRIDISGYTVRSSRCHGCLRFYKTTLKDKSPLFNKLNTIINPMFDRQMEKIITQSELREAKEYARQSMKDSV